MLTSALFLILASFYVFNEGKRSSKAKEFPFLADRINGDTALFRGKDL